MVFRVGIGMMPRGEVALIVALVGLQRRILTQAAYGIIVLMTVVTTILAPPVLRYLFRGERQQLKGETISAPVQVQYSLVQRPHSLSLMAKLV